MPFVLETVEKDRDIRVRSSQTPILKAGHFEVRFAARCSSRKEKNPLPICPPGIVPCQQILPASHSDVWIMVWKKPFQFSGA